MTGKYETEIRLLFAGDVAPVQPEELEWAQSQPQALCSAIQDEVKASDAFIVNLECPLTHSHHQLSKYGPNLKSSAIVAEILMKMGVTAVSLANNHMLDYGQQGICDTMNALEKNHLRYFGAGPTAKLACEPLFLEIKGRRIGVLGYAEHEFNWQGDDDWTTGLIDPAGNILQIMKLKSKCDKLIVFAHCGPEHCHYPSPRMVRLFRAMIDAGADAVINSHSHAMMGIEQYKGGAICYGLGNFWFPRRGQSGDWNIGLMARLHLGLLNVTVDPIPVEYVPQTGIVPVDSIDFTESLRRISAQLSNDVFIDRKWKEYCLVQKKMLFRSACKAAIAMLPAIWYRKLFKRDYAKADGYFAKAANLFRGLVTCENYNEILSTIFDQMRKNE